MMRNRTLMIAVALTTFVVIVVAAVTANLPFKQPTPLITSQATAVPASLDPTTEALIHQREDQYRQALAETQAQLAEANAQITALQQQQTNAAPVLTGGAQGTTSNYAISAEQALAIALQAQPDAQVRKAPELVSLQGTPTYEIVADTGSFYVDAQSGTLQFNPAEAAGPITAKQAAQTAIAYLNGGTVERVQRTEKRDIQVYRVEFQDGSRIYVSVATGKVVYAEIQRTHAEQEEQEQGDD